MYQSLAYGEPAGLMRLRDAVARYVGAARGVRCEASQVIITNGLQHALEIASRVLLDPGDTVWFEDPGYPAARATLASAGGNIALVPVDDEGMDVKAGFARNPSPRLIYVTPSHQYPLGVTMPAARRLELLDIARRADAWILEDDYDSEYRHATHPIPSIQGLDANERVIYLGTFSKVLFPALRLGYIIVPSSLVDVFIRARVLAGRTSPTIDQEVVSDFIEEGFFERHIRRMRAAYRERQDALLDAGRKYLGGMVTIRPSQAGMHVLGWLDDKRISDKAASRAAAAMNIEAAPLSAYCVDAKLDGALLLGYGAISARQIRVGAETLARALSSLD
jgi:GntR family transcriptional regulator/MocR family aminotransferase